MNEKGLAASTHPRQLLNAFGAKPRKGMGQNFLVSARTMDRMVLLAGVDSNDVVLEIGTGLGRLTERLARKAAHVVTVEVDARLARIASARLADFANVRLLGCDFLRGKHRINPLVTDAVEQAQSGAKWLKVVSDLPYRISSPAVVCLLEWGVPLQGIHVMLQSDVADRLLGPPGSKQYGALTVFVQYRARVERLFSLPPEAFWPSPKVCSSFVRIVPSTPHPAAADYEAFRAAVSILFQNRRKTLGRALLIGWGHEAARRILQ